MWWLLFIGQAAATQLYVLSHGAQCDGDFEPATASECYSFYVEHLAGNSSYAVPWVRGGYSACIMDNLQLRSGPSSDCETALYCVCTHNPDSGSGDDEDCVTLGNPNEWPDGLHAIVWSLSGLLAIAVATIIAMCCTRRREKVSIEPSFSKSHSITEKWEMIRPDIQWAF